MTVRFKSEYQKSFRVPSPRSASPVRGVPSAGLRSDHMGTSREPCLQRRRRLGGRTRSCRSLLPLSDPGPSQASRTAPSADLKGSSAHRKDPKLATAAGPADPEAPPGPRPIAEPVQEPPEGLKAKPESGHHPGSQPAAEPAEKAANVSNALSCPQPRPLSGLQPSGKQVLRWKAGLTSGGHRSGSRTSEYRRQFGSKKPGAAVSPILTADQVLNSSRRGVTMETEYRQSYQDPVPPAKPRLRKHLEAQRVPLFHMYMKTEASQKKPRRHKNAPSHHGDEAPQVQRPCRKLTEYQSSFCSRPCRIPEEGGATDDQASQVAALRRQAQCFRRRAWGVNFCREHLNQLQSEHTVLWEPAETTASDPPTPPQNSDRRGPSRQGATEELRLPLNSPQSSRTDGEPPDAKTPEEENLVIDDEEEGRLPTPRLKMLPVQRTHHDLTTPATGGAILVGRLKSNGDVPAEQVALEAGPVLATPLRCKEAWSEVDATHVTPRVSSPVHESAELNEVKSPDPHSAPAPPPPVMATPPHCIQGSLRKADFQHNGDLGLRFRERLCPGGGCGSDPDDRLSVMSWRSAASCSEASAVLERARRRRDDFWGR